MPAVALVRSTSLLPVYRFVEQGGSRLAPIRQRLQPAFREPEMLVPVCLAGAIVEGAARASGVEDLGHQLGRATAITGFGEWGTMIARSLTLADFVRLAIGRYRQFNSGYRLWTVVRGHEASIHLRYAGSLREGRRHAYDLALILWLGAFRELLGPSWRPAWIHLEGAPPRHAAELAALASHGIEFEQQDMAFSFPAHLLARRHAPGPLGAPWRGGPVPASDFLGSVYQLAESLLRLGSLDLAAAAEATGSSERSLQRHLAACGVSFSTIVERVRYQAACRMLADPRHRVIDVATELGYLDAANFTRAFRRWAGVSPQLYRYANVTLASDAAR